MHKFSNSILAFRYNAQLLVCKMLSTSKCDLVVSFCKLLLCNFLWFLATIGLYKMLLSTWVLLLFLITTIITTITIREQMCLKHQDQFIWKCKIGLVMPIKLCQVQFSIDQKNIYIEKNNDMLEVDLNRNKVRTHIMLIDLLSFQIYCV